MAMCADIIAYALVDSQTNLSYTGYVTESIMQIDN